MKSFQIEHPFILTIFGASGDLAKLKLFPAIYSLMEQKKLPGQFHIIGFARSEKSDKEFQKEFTQSIISKFKKNIDKKLLEKLTSKVSYFQGAYNERKSFIEYKKYSAQLTKNQKTAHIAYLSVPPKIFKPIIENLGETKTSTEETRIVIEKPFGEDTASATKLFHFLARYFDEDHIYLLDHYLGKTTVQSILHLRHSNRILNQMMKGTEIANIQITAFEDIGIENRVGYFDQVGIVKDMVQSHLLQLLALTTMSIPITESHISLHREKYSILSALNFPKSANNVSIGQYSSYKNLEGIRTKSTTETFAAVRLFIDRESWYKVPIYVRTGKKLHEKHTYIVIEFKKFAFQNKKEEPNLLIIDLHPEEKISIRLINKNMFGESLTQSITTSESLACRGDDCLPEHALLLLDVVRGRKIHFLSFPEIIASWRVTEEIISSIKKNNLKPEIYSDNSDGPRSQRQLTSIDNFHWYDFH